MAATNALPSAIKVCAIKTRVLRLEYKSNNY